MIIKLNMAASCSLKKIKIWHDISRLILIPKPFLQSNHFTTSVAACNKKRPRVLPVIHQILHEYNAQYFTQFPQLTREDLEEPPAKVSDEVRELLQASRARFDGNKFLPGQIKQWQFRRKRKELIKAGHSFPVMPMRDRMLDSMPKVRHHVIAKEERVNKIEENMKMMPKWIADYKEERRLKILKAKKHKEEHKVALMYIEKLGLHPKDPRAKQIMDQKMNKVETNVKKKKKFGEKKKKVE